MICTIEMPPPAPGPKQPAYAVEVAHLKEHPGQWFTIKDGPTKAAAWSAAAAIKQGKVVAFRPVSDFEVYTHGAHVNARYISTGETQP